MASRRSTTHRSYSARRRGMAAKTGSPATDGGSTAAGRSTEDAGDFIRTLDVDDESRALEEGDRLAAIGDYEGARVNFARAWAAWRLPSILLKLAASEERCGRLVDALKNYDELKKMMMSGSEYMRAFTSYESHDPRATEAMREHAEQCLASLIERVGQLTVDCPPGTKVAIDGHEIERLDEQPIWVLPGEHVVSASLGGSTESVRIECSGGSIQTIIVLGGAARKQRRPD